LAHALHLQLIFDYVDDADAVRKQARLSAETAVGLERDDADIQVALGAVHWAEGEIEEACSAYDRAIELNPSSAVAHSLLGAALGMGGRAEEGLDHHRIAIRLSPHDPSLAIMLGRFSNTCNAARRYEEAFEIAKKAIRLSNGRIWHNFVNSIVALGYLERTDEARMQIQRMKLLHPDVTIDTVRSAYRFMNPDYVEHYVDGLRKAGMPE
jgi:tetratricopeptide (TPR) repeat protein